MNTSDVLFVFHMQYFTFMMKHILSLIDDHWQPTSFWTFISLVGMPVSKSIRHWSQFRGVTKVTNIMWFLSTHTTYPSLLSEDWHEYPDIEVVSTNHKSASNRFHKTSKHNILSSFCVCIVYSVESKNFFPKGLFNIVDVLKNRYWGDSPIVGDFLA